jgi:hypothetical protein
VHGEPAVRLAPTRAAVRRVVLAVYGRADRLNRRYSVGNARTQGSQLHNVNGVAGTQGRNPIVAVPRVLERLFRLVLLG